MTRPLPLSLLALGCGLLLSAPTRAPADEFEPRVRQYFYYPIPVASYYYPGPGTYPAPPPLVSTYEYGAPWPAAYFTPVPIASYYYPPLRFVAPPVVLYTGQAQAAAGTPSAPQGR